MGSDGVSMASLTQPPAVSRMIRERNLAKLPGSDFREVGGAFPGRDGPTGPDCKDLIFNKIAASEGASHDFERALSQWPDTSRLRLVLRQPVEGYPTFKFQVWPVREVTTGENQNFKYLWLALAEPDY